MKFSRFLFFITIFSLAFLAPKQVCARSNQNLSGALKGITDILLGAGVCNCITKLFFKGNWWVPTPFYIGGALGGLILYQTKGKEITERETDAYLMGCLATICGIGWYYYKNK